MIQRIMPTKMTQIWSDLSAIYCHSKNQLHNQLVIINNSLP